jgi:hypothetical protein
VVYRIGTLDGDAAASEGLREGVELSLRVVNECRMNGMRRR